MKQNGFSNKSGLNVEFVVSQIYHSSFLNSKFYQGRLDFTFINQSSISMPYSSKFFVEILDINRHLDFKNAEKRIVLINYQVIMYANFKIISYFILHTKLCLVHSYWNLEKKWKHVDEVKSFQISEFLFFFTSITSQEKIKLKQSTIFGHKIWNQFLQSKFQDLFFPICFCAISSGGVLNAWVGVVC